MTSSTVIGRRVLERRRLHANGGPDRRRGDRRRRPEVEAELQTRSHAILTIPDLVMD
jgi:hypothetical protein